VLISQYVVHRHPEFWPEPERFAPDRFEPANADARRRFAWVPFGNGPRVCIGREFALMEGQIVLATLARATALEPVPGAQVVSDVTVTLRPRGLQLRARHW
jgi:cytochrome P450